MDALYGIFLKVLNMTLTASLVLLAVLALRFLLRKAPKQYSYLLWGIVLFRLLCPASLNSAFSLLNLAGLPVNGSGEIEYISRERAVPEEAPVAQSMPMYGSEGEGSATGSSSPSVSSVASIGQGDGTSGTEITPGAGKESSQEGRWAMGVWLLGAAALGAYSIGSVWRLHRRVACSMVLRDNIYLADYIPSPFVLGLLRPRIYLPSSLEEKEQGYIILHEQYHIRRKDYLIKPLAFFALCLHWFNPFVWLAFVLSMKDMEMSCDEAVMREMGGGIRTEYADSLLHLALGKRRVSGFPLAFGEGDTKSRIKNVIHYKKPAAVVGILAAVACLAGILCLATNPASKRETMEWAKHLSVEDIASIELVVMPQDPDKQYKALSPEEFAGAVTLIKQSRGKYLTSHEDLEGSSILLNITLKDGTGHQVWNMGNTYLYIDGDYYDAGYAWLSSWSQQYGEGNARIPDGFFLDGEKFASSVKFQAEIVEINDSRMVVEPVEGSSELNSADRIVIFSTSVKSSAGTLAEPKVGDLVEIEHNGTIMESYPAQLGEVYGITLLEEGEGQDPASSEGQSRSNGQPLELEEMAAVNEAIMEHNGDFYENPDPDGYDFACCSFVNLETESSAPAIGSEDRIVTYYGWAYYAEYKFSQTDIEEVGGSNIPVALTFAWDEDGVQTLKEYWEPSDGEGYEADLRGKFPPSVVEDTLDGRKFVEQQVKNCYAQAIASAQLDMDAIIGRLLKAICGTPNPTSSFGDSAQGDGGLSDDFVFASSGPQDYIDAHSMEYQKLGYFGDATLQYCIKRFGQGNETGLEGHIMARLCEGLLDDKWNIPIKASTAATGQEWYDALKSENANFQERQIEPGEEFPLSLVKIGMPVFLPQNTGWLNNRTWKQSAENQLEIQYDDAILGGHCTLWAGKGSEPALPEVEYDAAKEENWEGTASSGQMVYVKVQQAKEHVLATWEYQDYKFAIFADLSEGHPGTSGDIVSVPKTALEIVRNLE